MKLLSLLVLLLCLSACRPAWQDALEAGQRARDAGDDVGAAAQFLRACEQGAPEDTGACAAAKTTAARAAHEAIERSEKSCRSGEIGLCFSGLAPVRAVNAQGSKERSKIEELLEVCSEVHTSSCGQLPLRNLDDAVARYRCVALLRAEMALPAHETRVDNQTHQIAAFLQQETHRHESKTAFGAAAVNAGLAQCTIGGTETKRWVDDDSALFFSAGRLPARVQIAGSSSSAKERLCQGLGRGPLQCSDDMEAATTGVAANGVLKIRKLKHTSKPTDKLIEYVAGIEKIANPEFESISRQIKAEARALREHEQAASAAKSECTRAGDALVKAGNCTSCAELTEQEKSCSKSKDLADVLQKAIDALDSKKAQLSRTPPELERERRATHSWIETRHTWTLPFELSIDGGVAVQDSVVVEDTENPGFAPAHIEARKIHEPSTSSLQTQVEDRANAQVMAELTRQLVARAKALAPSCHAVVEDGPRLDCELKALWYGGSEPVATWLNELENRVTAPWPRAACVH